MNILFVSGKNYLICTLLIFFSCRNEKEVDVTNTVFRYNQPNPITSLDPAFSKTQNNNWAINHIYNCLVKLDDSLKVVPSIAKSWKISEDGLNYIFNLRSDVYFHDNACFKNNKGRRVIASDVVYSLKRLNDTIINSPGSWLFSSIADVNNAFYAINDSIFELRLTKPFVPVLGMLTMQYCSIVPKEALDFYGKKFRSNPVGTGPFRLKRWEEDQALFLQMNKNYFDKTEVPKMDYIKTTFMPDKQIAMLELLAGRLDFIAGIESSFINELLSKKGELLENKKSKIQYVKTPYLNHEYLGINMKQIKPLSPFYYKKVRQALNYAIDRKIMLGVLRNNVGFSANAGFVPRGLPSFDSIKVKGYTYDVEKALTLLKEAGFPFGKGLKPIVIHTNNEYLDLCTFVAKQWEKIGIKTSIEIKETAILREGMRTSSLSMFRASWIADYPDAESFFTMFYSKNPAPPNYTRFANTKFDQLYELSVKEKDTNRRYELYHKMDNILIDESPVIFLFYDQSSVFLSKNIKGFTNNGINLLNVNRIFK